MGARSHSHARIRPPNPAHMRFPLAAEALGPRARQSPNPSDPPMTKPRLGPELLPVQRLLGRVRGAPAAHRRVALARARARRGRHDARRPDAPHLLPHVAPGRLLPVLLGGEHLPLRALLQALRAPRHVGLRPELLRLQHLGAGVASAGVRGPHAGASVGGAVVGAAGAPALLRGAEDGGHPLAVVRRQDGGRGAAAPPGRWLDRPPNGKKGRQSSDAPFL